MKLLPVAGLLLSILVLGADSSDDSNNEYQCYHYTGDDMSWKSDNSASEVDMCERHAGFVYSQGNDNLAPGCGECWCCSPTDSSSDDSSSDDSSSDDSSSDDSSSGGSSCEPQYYATKGNLQIITSPDYPSKYPNNIDMCTSVISAGAGEQVQLVFTEFLLQAGYGCPVNPCPYDYVEVKDGDSFSARLIGKYCGNDDPGTITSQNGALYVDFYSNGNIRKAGFTATFEAIEQ